jgi:biopolymer transport protein ExbB
MTLLALSFTDSLRNVWNFFHQGGWAMIPIVACSFIAVVIIIYKIQDLAWKTAIPPEMESNLDGIEDLVARGQMDVLQKQLETSESLLGRICRHALRPGHATREEAARSTEAMAREEVAKLESGISTLEVIFTITPLLGLIGTAGGLVTIFANFGGQAQTADQAGMIARGISEALNCTVAGLAVAVPAYIFQTYFSRKVERISNRLAALVTQLLNVAYRTVETPSAPAPAIAPVPAAAPPRAATKEKRDLVIKPDPEPEPGDLPEKAAAKA